MASVYPGSLDSFTTHSAGQTITSADINKIQDAALAIETALGINLVNAGGQAQGRAEQYGYELTGGMGTMFQRQSGGNSFSSTSSQELMLAYFRAPSSITVNTVRYGLTVASSGTTLSRFGIYSITASTGALVSLLGSCANDTGIFTGTTSNSAFRTKALSAGVALTKDTWYAFAALNVHSGSPAQVWSHVTASPGAVLMLNAPVICAKATGQTDLPASLAAGSLVSSSGIRVFAELLT